MRGWGGGGGRVLGSGLGSQHPIPTLWFSLWSFWILLNHNSIYTWPWLLMLSPAACLTSLQTQAGQNAGSQRASYWGPSFSIALCSGFKTFTWYNCSSTSQQALNSYKVLVFQLDFLHSYDFFVGSPSKWYQLWVLELRVCLFQRGAEFQRGAVALKPVIQSFSCINYIPN